ncbi:alpha/beta hydrolase [Permianibacter sp. IMCC34836]|uniref:acyl-CoA thioester hydrolase/BAAT C-terminal domain-containing protein n=1 Tax=Permianibacter fluminis TaxID=2738515 RepID=UPI001551C2A6|nr:acyl-CoA thioester hydrolase/BAAT C-terminal domain-containing protein [Permianibacter fluminis]NQD38294.1 alpha/beta hydrolase [Permianibacter fluminis]
MRRLLFVTAIVVALFSTNGNASSFDYAVKPVQYKGLVANLYLPKTDKKVPVVIAFGGSEGGLGTGNANGEMLAPTGVAVLGLAYFKEVGLPQTLDQIPMEYFLNAVNYLETVVEVDANRIGVVAGSRGTEAAFLLATLDQRIKSVVATTPSKVAWFGKTVAKSAWTFNGESIPALSLALDENAPLLRRFEVALEDKDRVAPAQFKFEKINGPILLISASQDQIWPSFQMAKDIELYLAQHHFSHKVTHLTYQTGHGFSKETAPEIKQLIITHFLDTL